MIILCEMVREWRPFRLEGPGGNKQHLCQPQNIYVGDTSTITINLLVKILYICITSVIHFQRCLQLTVNFSDPHFPHL